MPDDSNGIYSVPAGTIVTTGDTILPSQHNPWANDSASAISNRFSKDGRAPATGNWNINNFRLTNVGAPASGGDAVNKTYADGLSSDKLNILQPSVDVASAATTDIGAAASQNVRVIGTTTITSLGTASAGTFRRVLFSGALTLTHNATSLILPDGVNIITVAGDVFEFVSDGGGNWRCTKSPAKQSFDVYAPAYNRWRTIGFQLATVAVSSFDFANLGGYRALRGRMHIVPSAAARPSIRLSSDNGSTWTSGTSYDWHSLRFSGTAAVASIASGQAQVLLSAVDVSSSANFGLFDADFELFSFNQAKYTGVIYNSRYVNAPPSESNFGETGRGVLATNVVQNGLRVFNALAGNFNAGSWVELEGMA